MQWLDIIFKFIEKIFKTNSFRKKYKTKNIKKLTTLLKSKKWQIIDIRNQISFNEHHLEGTINIPITAFNFKFFKLIDKNHNILIINEDPRSHLSIYKKLNTRGFKVFILNEKYKNIRNDISFDKYTKVVIY
ncbi:rhodanese-like domain-containing protein [Spiroplasma taiwanense]|nr:rhodanese-like domain-containing protein [Spiroplasma taiwanense]